MTKLKAEKRDIFGKTLKVSRTEGKLPIVVYGMGNESKSYFVSMADFKKTLQSAGESTIITLETEEGNKDTLIHDVAYHPVNDEPLHADFLVVDMNKSITVGVELVFEGVSLAVKDLGGMLVKVLHEVEIEALPKNLPHELIVDISSLTTLDSHIKVSDLKLPAGVTMITDGEEIVASITEAGEEVKEEEAPVDLSAIEVEAKGKKEEEGATEEAKAE